MKINLFRNSIFFLLLASVTVATAGGNEERKDLTFAPIMRPKVEGTEAKGVIKMNLSSLIFTNLAFQTEYAFHKNLSGALGFSYLLGTKLPPVISSAGLADTKVNGYSLTPEFRFYPGKKEKHQAPHGFYFAPYARYAKFNFSASYLDAVRNFNGTIDATYSGFAGGLMIGSQWIIGNHFSIDLFIVGGHVGSGSLEINAYDPNVSEMDDLEKEAVKQSIKNTASFIGTGSATVEGDNIKASFATPFNGLRGLGLNIGFAF
jgi:hypothetical protein